MAQTSPHEELGRFVQMMHEPDVIDDFCKSDDDFHELLMSTLPNKYLRSAYDRITGLNTRFRIMTGKVSMINREQTCEEHLEILEPALKGDWNTAADALQKHLEIARDKAEGRHQGHPAVVRRNASPACRCCWTTSARLCWKTGCSGRMPSGRAASGWIL